MQQKKIYISNIDGVIISEVNIYNQIGQKVLTETQLTGVINISELRQGMYVVEVVSEEWVVREKLIVR
ncbi:MAG: T9SS type A sorting domain-containing protein [Bacteroidales bacterium]|nr:T9SS type A sorting domain-containing protein [Bacteroidales bacterium]